jgi:DNA-binding NtrC family response regulator
MIVDDEIDIIGLFTEILTLNGISVRPFTNPEDALDDFKQNHGNYRLIISDVRMGVQCQDLISSQGPGKLTPGLTSY